MVDEARWHLKHNGLSNCFVVHGAVGLPPEETSTIFYVHPSSSASSVLPYEPNRQVLVKGRIAAVTVPAVSVAEEWLRRFGQAQVDIMKVDIEGKEMDFVSNEGSFLQKFVRNLVIEWHKWHVDLTDMTAILESLGFEQAGVYDENQVAGLATYRNLRMRVRT